MREKDCFLSDCLVQTDEANDGRQFDLICCQGAVPCLSWNEAVQAVILLVLLLKPDGRLSLLASGSAFIGQRSNIKKRLTATENNDTLVSMID